ncbi:ABC transporter permease [Glycomyces harbinensis]|uniref:Simple sugar transport system permease protein n=1 Tax=Glycomyces harbinensis TaxID=58114 RepID=A0A1G6VB13_9ACTN|nr:ABC transporter permease [Glycomyces harbinensis]SDD50772.1 simple sugar transport system permease protein [Glycomyces harbinensis]
MAVDTAPAPALVDERAPARHLRAGIVYAVLGLLVILAAVALLGDRTTTVAFDKTLTDASWDAPTRTVVLILGVIATAAGAWMIAGLPQRWYKIAGAAAVAAVVLALLFWAYSQEGTVFRAESILAGALFLSMPYIFGALSGVVCERSGVINIGIEGQFLMGAFTGVLVANITGNIYAGLAGAMIAGSLSTMLLALLATRFQVNQVVVGVILNLLALGFTSFMYDQLKKADGLNDAFSVPVISWGPLADIPVIGPVLFQQKLFVYVGLVMVAVVWFLLYRTRWGLRTRAVGEHPAAADSMGVNVNRLRYWNVVAAGLLAGFGGAWFTLGNSLAFNKNMTAGLGFVALAVMIVGRWNPLGVLAGALIFGFTTQIARDLSAAGSSVPGEFLQMLPYAVTLVVVAGLIGRAKAPAADGVPYNPGDK